jgi:mono/diheme cytochrome c family protein
VADATLAGIYSEEQAERGRGTFRSVCGECHYSREFRDDQFKFSWRRRSVADLFGHIAETMPENAPGSLSPRQYADVVAYILSLNGIPAGSEELPTDRDALAAYNLTALSGN